MSTLYKLPLVLQPQPEGGYVVTCPLLPELITEGESAEQALQNAKDALEAVVEGYQHLGKPLPPVLQPAAGASSRLKEKRGISHSITPQRAPQARAAPSPTPTARR